MEGVKPLALFLPLLPIGRISQGRWAPVPRAKLSSTSSGRRGQFQPHCSSSDRRKPAALVSWGQTERGRERTQDRGQGMRLQAPALLWTGFGPLSVPQFPPGAAPTVEWALALPQTCSSSLRGRWGIFLGFSVCVSSTPFSKMFSFANLFG